jgi:hypothetical protein
MTQHALCPACILSAEHHSAAPYPLHATCFVACSFTYSDNMAALMRISNPNLGYKLLLLIQGWSTRPAVLGLQIADDMADSNSAWLHSLTRAACAAAPLP